MPGIPVHLIISTLGVTAGVLLTWTQVSPQGGWEPTPLAHAGMALVAVGALLGLGRQLLRRSPGD